jgi:hypothetical protein
MKITRIAALLLVLTFLLAGSAWPATDSKPLTINATVAARATLTLGVPAINFPDADPGTVTDIPANENPVSVTASVRTGASSHPTLTVKTGGNLISGSDSIPITQVTWTATGSFVGGTMNTTDTTASATWTGSGTRNGSFSYFLKNSWDYATGSYAATATYTLTAP